MAASSKLMHLNGIYTASESKESVDITKNLSAFSKSSIGVKFQRAIDEGYVLSIGGEGQVEVFASERSFEHAKQWQLCVYMLVTIVHDCGNVDCKHDKTPRVVLEKLVHNFAKTPGLPGRQVFIDDAYDADITFGNFSNMDDVAKRYGSRRSLLPLMGHTIALVDHGMNTEETDEHHFLNVYYQQCFTTARSLHKFVVSRAKYGALHYYKTINQIQQNLYLYPIKERIFFDCMYIDEQGNVSWIY